MITTHLTYHKQKQSLATPHKQNRSEKNTVNKARTDLPGQQFSASVYPSGHIQVVPPPIFSTQVPPDLHVLTEHSTTSTIIKYIIHY